MGCINKVEPWEEASFTTKMKDEHLRKKNLLKVLETFTEIFNSPLLCQHNEVSGTLIVQVTTYDCVLYLTACQFNQLIMNLMFHL